jgi:hypothetical protein
VKLDCGARIIGHAHEPLPVVARGIKCIPTKVIRLFGNLGEFFSSDGKIEFA